MCERLLVFVSCLIVDMVSMLFEGLDHRCSRV